MDDPAWAVENNYPKFDTKEISRVKAAATITWSEYDNPTQWMKQRIVHSAATGPVQIYLLLSVVFPKELALLVASATIRPLWDMNLVVVLDSTECYSEQWEAGHTLNPDPAKGWFGLNSTGWISYDLGAESLVTKMSIRGNGNMVRTGIFETAVAPDGPFTPAFHFETLHYLVEGSGSPWKGWNHYENIFICARYIRINCLTSHGSPVGFYDLRFNWTNADEEINEAARTAGIQKPQPRQEIDDEDDFGDIFG